MSTIVFYEKPGCRGNARQRRMLEAAGHTVLARSLLAEPWTAERLRGFFGQTPVASWFNPAAPAIKDGSVDPAAMDAATALARLVAEPLLIRRPLAEVAGLNLAGFEALATHLGLPADDAAALTGCSHPQSHPHPSCPAPASTGTP
ncbi:MAG: arsenate reductase family protein [Azospirillaceae bacterium]|nr:arsenate reductase family protein [Azospirillaceae bacterium]